MFRLLYKAIFMFQFKRTFLYIQLAVPLKYETSFTLECKI